MYFRRHRGDNPAEAVPGREFLDSCPAGVRVMRGDMRGWFEVRADGPNPSGGKGRRHYRLFCLLDYDAQDAARPLLVVVTGPDKPFRTTISAQDYARPRAGPGVPGQQPSVARLMPAYPGRAECS